MIDDSPTGGADDVEEEVGPGRKRYGSFDENEDEDKEQKDLEEVQDKFVKSKLKRSNNN